MMIAVVGLLSASAHAAWCDSGDQNVPFARNDLVSVQQHMKRVIDALGALPAPYTMTDKNWSLPTSSCHGKLGYAAISVQYSGEFSVRQNAQDLQAAYQKKIMAAQAKGDYAAMQKLAQQMMASSMAVGMAGAANTPVSIEIRVNVSDNETINPLNVLRDGHGFIALRQPGGDTNNATVIVYFDAVQLKDAHQLASFTLNNNWRSPDKLALVNAEFTLSGPKAQVEQLIKQLDAVAVLNQLTAKRVEPKSDNGNTPGC
ncbi:MAG TPA: hypothetical protein VFK24_03330 [Gammaproteobacteria bacterium]|nr:hypothetical protein [Gammaproteobacteria bacterium]